MNICRACLSGTGELVGIDSACLDNYNLLTDLAIKLDDPLPQSLCRSCRDTVDHFIHFRNKCISSEVTLNACIIKNVKFEQDSKTKTEPDKVKDTSLSDAKVKLEIDYNDDGETYFVGGDETYIDEDDYVALVIKSEVSDNVEEKKTRQKRKCTKATSVSAPKVTTKNDKKEKPVRAARVYSKKEKKAKPIKVDEKLSCGLCKSSFGSRETLQSHLEGHKSDTTCRLCGERYKEWPELIAHRFKHITDTNQLRCHLCWKAYRVVIKMHYHYLIEHYDKEFTGMKCNICCKMFENGYKLNKHDRTAHSSRRFICNECGKMYHTKQNLAIHIQSHSKVPLFFCDRCDFSCTYKSSLSSHTTRKHTNRKFSCKKCYQVFKHEKSIATHTCGYFKVPIVCPVCGKSFFTQQQLSNHSKSHSSDRPLKCPRCPATYKGKAALRVHIDRHDNNRRYKCEFCTMRFFTRNVLIKHRRTHTGEKPFVCEVCDKGFTGLHNLRVHMRVHGEFLVKKKTDDDSNEKTSFYE